MRVAFGSKMMSKLLYPENMLTGSSSLGADRKSRLVKAPTFVNGFPGLPGGASVPPVSTVELAGSEAGGTTAGDLRPFVNILVAELPINAMYARLMVVVCVYVYVVCGREGGVSAPSKSPSARTHDHAGRNSVCVRSFRSRALSEPANRKQ